MKIKEKLTFEDFKMMSILEEKFYDCSHITPAAEAYDWYKKFPYSTRVMEDENQIIGFVDMFLITDEIFHAIKSGKFNDKNLTSEGIVDIYKVSQGTYHMFLCCLVIEEQYRKTDALKILLNEHIQFYRQLEEKGIHIDNIITDNVTDSGARFSQKLGFQKQTDSNFSSVIYLMDYKEFKENFNKLK